MRNSFLIWTLLLTAIPAFGDAPKPLPVGYDAYRQWDLWPYQRLGCRAYMRSTYDRRGNNEHADASHFLYQVQPDFNVTLDVEGKGILYFVRTNHWHGSPWHYEIDGKDNVVTETSTADPDHPAENSTFIPAEPFPNPMAFTWSTTKGADLSWVPMGFERSLRLAYGRTHYGTGYYIYHRFAEGTPLSQPITAFDFQMSPPYEVRHLLASAGEDIAPRNQETNTVEKTFHQEAKRIDLQGPLTIRALKFVIPRSQALEYSNARLQITWDNRPEPSVDVPLALFFGAGILYNRDQREYLVKALPVNIRFTDDEVDLACYFPMPFFKSAKIELVNCPQKTKIAAEIRTQPFKDSPADVGYFHATYKDHPNPDRGKDLVLLDTRGIEGSQNWTGSFVGTSFIFTDRAVLNTLEGDPRFIFDDAETPQAWGTGTEEWGGGGDYWGGLTMTLPLAGHPTGCRKANEAKSPEDLIHSAYRFLLADLFPFGKNAQIHLEHGGVNDSEEHYQTVTYWYGLPAASVVQTDKLAIGDKASEQAHDYSSPHASEPQTITSRFELGPDTVRPPKNSASKEPIVVYPAHDEIERHTKDVSEFTLKLDQQNQGVFLRRTFDYSLTNQRAEVFVADAATPDRFEPAGVWYVAGSNTCYHSNPKGELDPAQPEPKTSNRRFRDDEFLLPMALTKGRSAIRVRVKFTPVDRPLLPGREAGPAGWSEIGYAAYCWVKPAFSMKE